MPDREKVIKALECRKNADKRCGNPCEDTGLCHYATAVRGLDGEIYKPFICDRERICADALALLEEQESIVEALKSDLDETLAVLSEQPEIVRCRECKYGCLMASGKVYMCESPEQNKKICIHVHKPDWFCANGEKSDG